MAKRTIEIQILGDASSAREALQGLDGDSDSLTGKLGNLAKTGLKVAAGAAIGLGAAVAGATVSTAKHADEVAKAARQAGVSATTYQELEYALGQAGIEQGTVNRLLERNTQRLGRANEGNEKLQEAYANLGVNIHDANGELRSSEDVFDDVMRGLAGVENDAERAALAGELLGTKAGRELAGALGPGIEGIDEARERAHDLGIVLGDDTLDAAEAFNDGIDNIQRALGGMVSQVGAKVLPGVVPLVETFAEKLPGALETASDWVGTLLDRLEGPVVSVFGTARDVVTRFAEVALPAIRDFANDIADFFTETLLPAAQDLFEWLQPKLSDLAGWFLNTALPAVREFANDVRGFLLDTVLPAAQDLMEWLLPKIEDLAEWFTEKALPAIRDFANDVADFFTETLLPAAQDLFEWLLPKLEDFAEWFVETGVPSALDAISEAFEAIRDRVEPVFDMLKENKDAVLVGLAAVLVGAVVPAFIAWTAATWASVAAHIAAAIAWMKAYLPIIAILAAVGIAAALLYKAWDTNFLGIRDILQDAWDFIKPILQAVWDRLSDFIEEILPDLIATWESLRDNVQKAVKSLWNDVIEPAFNSIKNFLEEHGDTIKAVLKGAWEIIESSITTAVDVIQGILTAFLALIRGDWDEAWDAIKGVADSVWDHIKTVFGNLRDFVVGAFETIKDRTVSTIEGWAEDVTGFFSGLKDDVVGFARDIRDDVTGFIGDLVGETWKTVKSWVEDVVGKAKELYDDVTSWVEDLVKDVVQFYVDLAEDVWESFKDLVDDLVGKAKELYDDVTQWVEDLVTDVVQFYVDLAEDVWESFRDLVDDLVGKAKELYDDVTQWVEDLVTDVVQFYVDLAKDVWELWEDLVDDVVGKAKDLWEDVTGYVKDLYDDGVEFFTDLRDDATDLFNDLKDNALEKVDDLLSGINNLKEDLKDAILWPFREARDAVKGITEALGNRFLDPVRSALGGFKTFVDGIKDAVNWVSNKLQMGDVISGSWEVPDIPRLHSGARDFPGGPAIIKGEELVVLPAGTDVYNPTETRAIMDGIDAPGPFGQRATIDPRFPSIGGPWEWGRDQFSGLIDWGSDLFNLVTDWASKGASWVADQAFSAVNLPSLDLPGIWSRIASEITKVIIDGVKEAIRGLISRAEDSLEAPPVETGTHDGPVPDATGWVRPVGGPITQRYGHTSFSHNYAGNFHTGIDYGGGFGVPIRAANAGVVAAQGWSGGYGLRAILAHANNLATLYAHMQRILVNVGQMVSGGQQIGEMGSTGFSTGPHLHFEVWENGQHRNPANYVGFKTGGTLPEDIFGTGPSGTNYLLHGGEEVIPAGATGGAPVVNFYGDVHVDGDRNDPTGALGDVAWATTTALRRRGLR